MSTSASSPGTTPSTPFPSWTFDKPCPKMEWNTLSTKAKLLAGNTSIESVDFVMIGVFNPTTNSTHNQGTHEEPLFTGSMLKMNQGMNNALQDLYYEQDAKTRGVVGTVSPTLRTTTPTSSSSSTGSTTKRYAIVSLGPSWLDTVSTATSVAAILGTSSATSTSQLPPPPPPAAIGLTIGKAIAKACNNEKKIQVASIHLPDTIINNHIILRDIATSFYTELYQDHRYKGRKDPSAASADSDVVLTTVYIRCEDGVVSQDILDAGCTIAQGVSLTKDIVNAPHNVLNSMSLAETAQRIATLSIDHRIQCQILNKEQCEALNMGAYLGVARGSETPPQFIHLSYMAPPSKDSATPRKRIGFVGKGLLFDTGGYNIKTQMMELMKFDCGGAAAVLGAAHAIGQIPSQHQELLPKNIEIHFIVAACENMINDRAIVPSDVLTASNGTTIEILNTDAEGRLTLADALVYADVTCQCDTIIELSTLTGACMISLGKDICGLWTYNDALAEEITAISKITNDKSWRMPLPSEYEEQIQSKIADLQNLGGKYGGAITAALFLQHFVNHKEKAFAHLDIAGPVWDDKTGATGFGTKLIIEYITRQGK